MTSRITFISFIPSKTLVKGPRKRGNIVADANVSLFARTTNTCCGRKICVRDAKNVSEFFQKHFASATNAREMFLGLRGKEAKHLFCFPLVCSQWEHYEQQCFRNNVSSFSGALRIARKLDANKKQIRHIPHVTLASLVNLVPRVSLLPAPRQTLGTRLCARIKIM